MKHTNKTKLTATILAFALIFLMGGGAELLAQNFISDGTNSAYQATCGGVIKMKNLNSQFQNNGGADLGSASNPIQGVVDWAATGNTQTVQGLYYERMVVSGGQKNIQDGVYITAGACATPLVGYANLATYPFYTTTAVSNLTFNGTFHYTGTDAQNIYPIYNAGGGQPGNYNILDLTSTGGSTIRDGESVGAYNVTTASNSPLTVTGDLYLGAGTSDFNGTVTLNNVNASIVTGSGNISFDNIVTLTDGAIEGSGSGNVSFTSTVNIADGDINLSNGSGNFTFDGAVSITGSGGSINAGAGSGDIVFNSTVGITGGGAITLAGTSGTVTFADDFNLTNGSLTAADNAGDVTIGAGSDFAIGTNGSISFGDNTNLFITGTISNAGDGTNLTFDCGSTTTYNGTQNPQIILPTLNQNNQRYGNLVLSGGNKRGGTATYGNDVNLCGNFSLTGGNVDMYTNNGTLRMSTPSATATYTGDYEVAGQFERVTDATARTYTFNNTYTTVALAADADNPTSMLFNVRGSVNPNQYDANTDVNRKVTLSYSGGAGGDFLMTLSVGYLYDEHPTGGWTGLNTQARIRFYEATPTAVEKIGTGYAYSNTAAAGAGQFGAVSLQGIGRATSTVPNGNNLFFSGNDVLLRTGATPFISVNDGRWTNPNTWDEATTPTQNDNVFIRHVVYAGIDGPFAGTSGGADEVAANNTLREVTVYGTDPAAYTITIEDGVTYPRASLVLGNEDNGDGYIFKTAATTGNSFINNNTQTPAGTFPIGAKASVEREHLNGLWLTPYGSSGTRATIFSTYQIENKGTIRNEGIIEIGE